MRSRFSTFAWAVLAWNLLVVLWGAYVRASGSGAGCGNNWPLCNGGVVPAASRLDTIIEFAHRASSGMALIAVIALAAWSMFRLPRGHRVRRVATLSAVFIIVEVGLGAGIVLFRYVSQDASVGRAIYLSLHLVNTQLLLASLALTAWFSREPPEMAAGRANRIVVATLPVALAVSISGVIAALADTLFPALSLSQGMLQDISGRAHFLVRLRILHPILAISGAAYCLFAAGRVLRSIPSRVSVNIALVVLLLTAVQLIAGTMNLVLLAPIWMQIVHLLFADLVWISLVLLAVETRKPVKLG